MEGGQIAGYIILGTLLIIFAVTVMLLDKFGR